MKKVNLINKKIMSTGLAASLLAASLGVNSCSAYKGTNVSVKKLTSSQSRVSLANTKSTPQPTKVKSNISKEPVKATNSTGTPAKNSNKTIETTKEKEDKKEIISKPLEKTSLNKTNSNGNVDVKTQPKLENECSETSKNENTNKNSSDKVDTKKSNSISKTEMAKTVAKVVAAAAIVGAATYFGYKYKAPIAETLNKGGAYLSNTASSFANSCKNKFATSKDYLANKAGSFANSCKNGFTTSKDYLANKAGSFANSCKNGFATSKDYLANKAGSFANSCKNGFATSKDYLANKATSIISNIKGLFNKPKCTDLVPYIDSEKILTTNNMQINYEFPLEKFNNWSQINESKLESKLKSIKSKNKAEAIFQALKNEIENDKNSPIKSKFSLKSFFKSIKNRLTSTANNCKKGSMASNFYSANRASSSNNAAFANEILKPNSTYTNSFVFNDMNKENSIGKFYINQSPIMKATEKSVNGIYISNVFKKAANCIWKFVKEPFQPIDMTRRYR